MRGGTMPIEKTSKVYIRARYARGKIHNVYTRSLFTVFTHIQCIGIIYEEKEGGFE